MTDHDKIRISFYFANVLHRETGAIKSIIDMNSHPFIWLANEGKLGNYWHLQFWKEITKEEYVMFLDFHKKGLIF